MQYVPSSGSHTFLAGPPSAIPPGPTLHAPPCPPSTRSSGYVAPRLHPSRPSNAVGAAAAVSTAIRAGVVPVAATVGDPMGGSATADVPHLGAAGAAALDGGGGGAALDGGGGAAASAAAGGCAAAVAAATSGSGGGAAAVATSVVVARSPVSLSHKSSDARALANPQEGSIAAHRVAALRAGKNILASRNGFASALTTACQTQPKQRDG